MNTIVIMSAKNSVQINYPPACVEIRGDQYVFDHSRRQLAEINSEECKTISSYIIYNRWKQSGKS